MYLFNETGRGTACIDPRSCSKVFKVSSNQRGPPLNHATLLFSNRKRVVAAPGVYVCLFQV